MKRILKFCTAALTALCMTVHASASGDDGLLIREECLLSVSGETTACEIPDGVREIADNAFSGAVNLEYIVIPASVEKVPEDFLRTLPEGTEVYYMGTWSAWREISGAGRYESDLYTADLILRIAAVPLLIIGAVLFGQYAVSEARETAGMQEAENDNGGEENED